MTKYHLHGDIGLVPAVLKTPAKAEKKTIHVLQDSSVTRNRHEVYSEKMSIARWSTDGKEYISCKAGFIIRHIGGDAEHGTQQVEAGTYEVRHEMEHDPWKNELRQVID